VRFRSCWEAAPVDEGETVSEAGSFVLEAVPAALSASGDGWRVVVWMVVAGVVVARESAAKLSAVGGSGRSSSSDSALKRLNFLSKHL
jgi:hypothetical protein